MAKNMERGSFIGLALALKIPKMMKMSSTTKGSGGVACQMVTGCTKSLIVIYMLVVSRTASSMSKVKNGTEMVINIKANLSMECLRVPVHIYGRTEALLKVISSKAKGTGMEFGKLTTEDWKLTRVTTRWTKNQAMESIYGTMDGVTKAILKMTTEMVMGSCMMLQKN